MKKIVYQNKTIAEIHPYVNLRGHNDEKPTPQNLVEYLTRTIPTSSTGYAGFRTKKYLRQSLLFHMFGPQAKLKNNDFVQLQPLVRKLSSLIEGTIKKAHRCLPSRTRTRIYIFPTFRSFVKEKMFGVNGMTPYRNVFHTYIHPNPRNRRVFYQELCRTVAHEYNHTVRFQHFLPSLSSTLLEGIINEGLAENFRMEVLGGAISPWAGSLQYDDTKKTFKRIRPLLRSTSSKVYYDIFFADKKYPLWTGYAIGYQIVKSFRQAFPALRWIDIIKLPSQEILKRSEWLTRKLAERRIKI